MHAYACKHMHIAKMNYSRLVAAYITLTLVGCLLAGVYALPASADPVTDSDGISDPLSGDEEQIDVNEEDVNDALRGVHYFGGDIILTPEQKAMIIEETSNPQQSSTDARRRRAVQRNQSILWHNGKVPYVLDSSLSSRARSTIAQAIQTYEQNSCIDFVQRTNEVDYVRFFKGRGCYSYVGRTGGAQRISIGRGCERTGIVLHEMFHALGRWHEQSRPDRDQYIRIIYDNIRSGTRHNFMKLSNTVVSTQGVPYDTGSIMHYGAHSFSRNGKPTIEPQPGVPRNRMGQRIKLTSQDLQHINKLYGCDQSEGSGSGTWSPWGPWSACSRTCNGGTRTRTRNCTGALYCEGTNIQEQQCNTRSCLVPANWGTWSNWSGCSVTCGGGSQTRSRSCLNGNTCTGQSTESRDCNTQNCPLSYQHVGCYELTRSSVLRTLARYDDSAVQNCAARTQVYGYTKFAVVAGYCISGSNNAEDYNSRPSNWCLNGQGRYIYWRRYYMDLYKITSPSQSGNVADDDYGNIGSLTLGPLPVNPSSPVPPPKPNPPRPQQTVQSGSASTVTEVYLHCILILVTLILIILL